MGNKVFVGPAEHKVDVKEAQASASILPGQFMVLDGANDEFDLAGADAGGILYIAGNNLFGERDEAYAVGETVQGYRPSSGEYYDVALAASQTIAEDAPLSTDASGNLVAQGAAANVAAYAAEAVTTTGEVGVIRVYIK